MIPGIGPQALRFALGAGLGVILGLLYDCFRGLRRLWRGLTVPCDGLFLLLFFLSLLLTMIYTRGLQGYQLLGIFLGWGLWSLTLSAGFLSLWGRLLGKGAQWAKWLGRQAKKYVKIFRKLAKKHFPSGSK